MGGGVRDQALEMGETFPPHQATQFKSLTGSLPKAFPENRGSIKVTAGCSQPTSPQDPSAAAGPLQQEPRANSPGWRRNNWSVLTTG